MKLLAERQVIYHTIQLEQGIDFDEHDIEQSYPTFRIKESRLDKIARDNGYDECERCSVMNRVTDRFVTTVFIKRIY